MNLPHIEPLVLARIMRDDETRRAIENRLKGKPRHVTIVGDAVPARAATASQPSLLRVSGIAGIAIALVAAVYFGAEFLR